jgi:hypothetical protein
MTLPFTNLNYARTYFLERAQELMAVNGTPWIFAGGTCLIEYLAKMKKGGRTDRFDFIDFVRSEMPAYANFHYSTPHRRVRRGGLFDMTDQDLPEQMYYILRCGLLHRFSLVPSSTEITNGGRLRSIWMIHQAAATQAHLSAISIPPDVPDSVVLISEVFINDISTLINTLFGRTALHGNILTCLNDCPPVFLF